MEEPPAQPTPPVRRRYEFLGVQPKWWLPVLLALIIAGIVLGAYFATHSGSSSKPTVTPTPRPPTATGTLPPTATPTKKKPTATAHVVVVTATPGPPTATPHATSTPRPTPRATSTTGPTSTPAASPTPSLQTGTITHTQAELNQIQQGANQNNPTYTPYLDPFQVVQQTLPKYGFKTVNIVSPTPQPTPTPYTGDSGLPEVQITVQYQGKQYLIVLDQPVQKGPKGIWVIVRIKPL